VAVARARAQESLRTTRALLVKRVEYGESDLVLTLFTERFGRVSALARGARKSARRFGGALEPMHTLEVRLEERPERELFGLREARIDKARLALTSELSRLEAAGKALGWLRRAAPARTPEPELWHGIEALLDRLAETGPVDADRMLAAAGLRFLAALGWGLDLERCVSCGKACPEGQAGLVDANRGGLVCRSCGGARRRLEGPERLRLARAAASGDPSSFEPGDAEVALDLVEQVLRAHAGME
jgi:DNA repair protein RecO (recombination protein O)